MPIKVLAGYFKGLIAQADPAHDAEDSFDERHYGYHIARVARALDQSPALIKGIFSTMPSDNAEAGTRGMILYARDKLSKMTEAEKDELRDAFVSTQPLYGAMPTAAPSTPSSP
jgi:hypothetical protein